MSDYLLTESVVSTAVLYIILKKIVTPFEQWDAYKLGIIDKDGNKLKSPVTGKERDSWDLLSKFCCNFKKIIIRFLGKANYITYFTLAYLLKDSIDYFYMDYNKDMLHEKYLQDFNISKQYKINTMIKNVESKYGKETVTEENVLVLICKYQKIFETEFDIESIL